MFVWNSAASGVRVCVVLFILGNYVGSSYKNIGLHLILYGSSVQTGKEQETRNCFTPSMRYSNLSR